MPHLPYRLLASLIVVAAFARLGRRHTRRHYLPGPWSRTANGSVQPDRTKKSPAPCSSSSILQIRITRRSSTSISRRATRAAGRVLRRSLHSRAAGPLTRVGIGPVEISNRGGKGLLTTFNRATPSADPMQPEHFGDGLLMRNGITLVWVGWEFDVPGIRSSRRPRRATARRSSKPSPPWAVVDARATEVSFSDVPLYPPVDPNDETAT